jgi:predicted nucleic acid-binding protein
MGLSHADVDDVLDYLCGVAKQRQIHYLWRPFLRDPNDDMLVELAVEGEADTIVTHNLRDFTGIDRFEIKAMTPQEFLTEIGELP